MWKSGGRIVWLNETQWKMNWLRVNHWITMVRKLKSYWDVACCASVHVLFRDVTVFLSALSCAVTWLMAWQQVQHAWKFYWHRILLVHCSLSSERHSINMVHAWKERRSRRHPSAAIRVFLHDKNIITCTFISASGEACKRQCLFGHTTRIAVHWESSKTSCYMESFLPCIQTDFSVKNTTLIYLGAVNAGGSGEKMQGCLTKTKRVQVLLLHNLMSSSKVLRWASHTYRQAYVPCGITL